MARVWFAPLLGLVMMVLLLGSSSCGTVEQKIAEDPDKVAAQLQKGAKLAIGEGLSMAIDHLPAKRDEILKDAQFALDIVQKTVLPTFTGASTAEVTGSVVNQVLDQLSGKISPTVSATIQLVISALGNSVKLPDNPAEKIPESTRKVLAGLFAGIADGLKLVVEVPPPVPAPVNPTARSAPPAPKKLVWPKN